MPTFTVNSTGGDYSSLVAAVAAQNGDHVLAGEITTLECYGFTDTTASQTIVDGGTANASFYLRIVAAPGAEAKMPFDISGSAYTLIYTGTDAAILTWDSYTRIERIQIQNTGNTGSYVTGIWSDSLGNGDEIWIDRCHLIGNSSSSATTIHLGVAITQTGTVYVTNTFVGNLNTALGAYLGVAYYSNTSGGSNPKIYTYNCTAYGDLTEGFAKRSDAIGRVFVAKNCISDNASTADFIGVFDTGTEYNASSDATASGTNALINQTFDFVSATDYHLNSSLSGVDLSADSVLPFNNDFDGNTRSSWDRGADEFSVDAYTDYQYDALIIAGYTGTINDMRMAYLEDRGFSSGTIDDNLNSFLFSLGYTVSSLGDKVKQWEGS